MIMNEKKIEILRDTPQHTQNPQIQFWHKRT